MKISTRGRYALRALLELAKWQKNTPLMLMQIARRQMIPDRYLIQIFGRLKNFGIIQSLRGARGGFKLAKPPEEITLADIIEAAEGPWELAPCLEKKGKGCKRREICVASKIWEQVSREIRGAMQKITLREMVQMEAEYSLWGEWTYQI